MRAAPSSLHLLATHVRQEDPAVRFNGGSAAPKTDSERVDAFAVDALELVVRAFDTATPTVEEVVVGRDAPAVAPGLTGTAGADACPRRADLAAPALDAAPSTVVGVAGGGDAHSAAPAGAGTARSLGASRRRADLSGRTAGSRGTAAGTVTGITRGADVAVITGLAGGVHITGRGIDRAEGRAAGAVAAGPDVPPPPLGASATTGATGVGGAPRKPV